MAHRSSLTRERHVATFVDSTLKQIDARLRELASEVSRLESARAPLVNGAPAARRPARPRRRGRPSQAAARTRAAARDDA